MAELEKLRVRIRQLEDLLRTVKSDLLVMNDAALKQETK